MEAPEEFARQLRDAGPGIAWMVLTDARQKVETARWHLERVVEHGESLQARLDGFGTVAAGNDVELVNAAGRVMNSREISDSLMTVERARAALAELAKWQERADG